MTPLFAGAFTALVTPFRQGEVDVRALSELVEAQLDAGIDGLVPCGTTGESVNLSDAEHATVVRATVEQARGRVPVLAGAGTASTRHSIELGSAAKEAGADGLLLVVPYYNRPTQAGLFAHFQTIAEKVSLPVVLYNIPSRTGVDLSLDTLERLAEVRSIAGIKEATGNSARSQQIAARFGDRFSILAGDDGLTVAVMAVGGHGVVSVAANVFPARVAEVVGAMRAGDVAKASALQRALLPFHEAMFVESNPGPVKAALAMRRRIAPEIRLPLVWPSEASQALIRSQLERVEAR